MDTIDKFMSNETYSPIFQRKKRDFIDDRGVSRAPGDTPGSPHPPVVATNDKRGSDSKENENMCSGQTVVAVEEANRLTEDVAERPRGKKPGNPEQFKSSNLKPKSSSARYRDLTDDQVHQPAAWGQDFPRLGSVHVEERTQEEIYLEKIITNILKRRISREEILYILGKLEKECRDRSVAVSVMFYDDGWLVDQNHDSSKEKFLCWVMTRTLQPMESHCVLLTNIDCFEPDHVLLLDSLSPKDDTYKLTTGVLNALGYIFKPKWDTEIKVIILNVQRQTKEEGEYLCFPYTYGFAIQILNRKTLTIEKIRFDEIKMPKDIAANLRSGKYLQPLTYRSIVSDLLRKVICVKVNINLTDPVPPPWELTCGGNGEMYFFNRKTRRTTGKDPRYIPYRPADQEMRLSNIHGDYVVIDIEPEPLTEGCLQPSAQSLFEKDQATEYGKDLGDPESGAFMDIHSNNKRADDNERPPQPAAERYAGYDDIIPATARRSADYEGQLSQTMSLLNISQKIVPEHFTD